ncbi:MAG: ABC transporter substrate-binding protein [Synergistales bacterium]|nr:ABC transporter substrate-binding protein [Synergistales bacterium]
MRNAVRLLSVAVVIGALLAAPVSAATDKPVTFVDFSWDSCQLHNRIMGYILEKGMDREAEYVFAESMPGLTGLERGDIDVVMEVWVDNVLEWWEQANEKATIVDLGANFPDAPQGWYVPTYLVEGDPERGIEPSAPDLKSVKDLPKYKELFVTPENPDKGRLYNGPAGWVCTSINVQKLETYGLADDFEAFSPGSQTALATAIAGAYKKGEPVLAYYWEPSWLIGLYDMTLLEEPPYREELWNDEGGFGCSYPAVRVRIAANADFADLNENIMAILRNYDTTLAQNNLVLSYMEKEDADLEEAAVWFLKTYPDVWKDWIPERMSDVAGNLEAALVEEEVK